MAVVSASAPTGLGAHNRKTPPSALGCVARAKTFSKVFFFCRQPRKPFSETRPQETAATLARQPIILKPNQYLRSIPPSLHPYNSLYELCPPSPGQTAHFLKPHPLHGRLFSHRTPAAESTVLNALNFSTCLKISFSASNILRVLNFLPVSV
ncbi:unnamed protein product [Laminaria digitata]